ETSAEIGSVVPHSIHSNKKSARNWRNRVLFILFCLFLFYLKNQISVAIISSPIKDRCDEFLCPKFIDISLAYLLNFFISQVLCNGIPFLRRGHYVLPVA